MSNRNAMKNLTKKFIEKVLHDRIVDTKNYRYRVNESTGYIERIPIEYLDTTKALEGWVQVENLNKIK